MLVSLKYKLAKPLREKDEHDTTEESKEHVENGESLPEEMNFSNGREKAYEEDERGNIFRILEHLHSNFLLTRLAPQGWSG
jgi:hypothetical protein